MIGNTRFASVLMLAVSLAIFPGTAQAVDEQPVEIDKVVEAARQALSAASTPEQRIEASQDLGCALLRKSGAEAKAEAADLFKEALASSGGSRARAGYYVALRELHRDGEATELLSSLKGGTRSDLTNPPCEALDSDMAEALNEYARAIDPKAALRATDKVMPPQIIKQVPPVVPPQALRKRGFRGGPVVLEAIIDSEGRVENVVRVLKGQPMGLTESAADCLRKWRFKPATLNGEPVKVYYVLTIFFQLRH